MLVDGGNILTSGVRGNCLIIFDLLGQCLEAVCRLLVCPAC